MLWSCDVGARVESSPAVSNTGKFIYHYLVFHLFIFVLFFLYIVFISLNSHRYVGSYDGSLVCINCSLGTVDWKFQTGNQVKSSPYPENLSSSDSPSPLHPLSVSSPSPPSSLRPLFLHSLPHSPPLFFSFLFFLFSSFLFLFLDTNKICGQAVRLCVGWQSRWTHARYLQVLFYPFYISFVFVIVYLNTFVIFLNHLSLILFT